MKSYKNCSGLLVLMLIGFSILSCKRENEHKPCCLNIEISYGFYLLDDKGNDLLNPNISGSYAHSGMGLYELAANGDMVLLTKKVVVEPLNKQSKYAIGINSFGNKVGNNQFVSYLKLSDKDIDTIKLETVESEGGIFKNKVWYNNKLVWDKNGTKTMPISIIK